MRTGLVTPEKAEVELRQLLPMPGGVKVHRLLDDNAGLSRTKDTARAALARSLPHWLYNQLCTDYGETRATRPGRPSTLRAPVCIRTNT